MGIERNDFIANPNRLEYVDDGELDLDEHPEVILDYVRDADDYFGLDEDDDDDDYVSEDDAINDRPNEEDPLSSDEFSEDIALEYSSNFLTDEDDVEDDELELQGVMINGVFVQTGGPVMHIYNTRASTAAAEAAAEAAATTATQSQAGEDNASKTSNANASNTNDNVMGNSNGNVEGNTHDAVAEAEA